MHIGKYKQKFKCTPVRLDQWTSKEIENKQTGKVELHEKYAGKMKISEVSEVKYLGSKLNSEGTNMMDIQEKCNKGVGTVNKIQTILQNMYFGKFYFEVGKTMIESMLLGSILTNIEVAYNLTLNEIDKLEKCHEMALRKLLDLPSKTPKQMLYFLTGSGPVRFQIQRRRLVYLHHILNQNEESLLRTFFEHQYKTRKSKDWATRIIKDLFEFGIEIPLEEIMKIPINVWKENVKLKTLENALIYLNSNIGSKSRPYTLLQMSPYLMPNEEVPIEIAKFIAKAQSNMIENVKMNFQQEYKPNFICNACMKNECNQPHLLYCPALLGSNQIVTYIPNYEDLFDDTNKEEQCFIARILIENLKRKKHIDNLKTF